MAAPSITKVGSNSNKTSGTSLAVTITGLTANAGDYIVVGFAMDPATGTISYSATGTAGLSTWTTIKDVANGSGTSGVRTVMAYAKVTSLGTVLTVTITHPTATAKSAEVFRVTGADGTTPVQTSGTDTTAGGTPSLTATASGADIATLDFNGYEVVSGTAFTYSVATGWTSGGSSDTSTSGTSGQASASNISVAFGWQTHTRVMSGAACSPSGNTITGSPSTATVEALWQFIPANTVPGTPTGVAVGSPTSTSLTVTWTDETVSYPVATYNVLRSTDNVTFTQVTSGIAAGTQTYTDSTLSSGTTYYYEVQATNSQGTTTSSSASGTTSGGTTNISSSDSGTGSEKNAIGTSDTGGGSGAENQSIGSVDTDTSTGTSLLGLGTIDGDGAAGSSVSGIGPTNSDSGVGHSGVNIYIVSGPFELAQATLGSGATLERQILPPPTAISSSDSGTGADAQGIGLSNLEGGTGSSGTPTIGTGTTDSGTGADTGTLSTPKTDTDSGTGSETWAITVRVGDSGTGSDSGWILGTFTLGKSTFGTNTLEWTGAGAFFHPSSSDSGNGSAAESIAASLTNPDSGVGADSPFVGTGNGDTGTGADTGTPQLTNQLSSSDSGTGNDTQTIAAPTTVTVELLETGTVLQTFPAVYDSVQQVFSFKWDASLLSDQTGAGVEVRITGAPESIYGHAIDIGAVEWVVAYTVGKSGATDTDSGTGADRNETIGTVNTDSGTSSSTQAIAVLNADSGTFSEDQSYHLASPANDSGTSLDVESIATSTVSSDLGVGQEGSFPNADVEVVEVGTGSALNLVAPLDSDLGSVTETTLTTLRYADAGSALDAATISASVATADTGSGSEAARLGVLASETATGIDGGEQRDIFDIFDGATATDNNAIGTAASDPATGADSGSVTVAGNNITSADSGTATETQSLTANVSSADIGTATEVGAIGGTAIITASDGAVSTEASALAIGGASDTSTGGDTAKPTLGAIDNGTGTESTSIVGSISTTENASGSETQKIAAGATDTGSGGDTSQPPAALISSSDIGAAVDAVFENLVSGVSDSSTEIEGVVLAAALVVLDAATEAETSVVDQPVNDTGTVTSTVSIITVINDTEHGTGNDTSQLQPITSTHDYDIYPATAKRNSTIATTKRSSTITLKKRQPSITTEKRNPTITALSREPAIEVT